MKEGHWSTSKIITKAVSKARTISLKFWITYVEWGNLTAKQWKPTLMEMGKEKQRNKGLVLSRKEITLMS